MSAGRVAAAHALALGSEASTRAHGRSERWRLAVRRVATYDAGKISRKAFEQPLKLETRVRIPHAVQGY